MCCDCGIVNSNANEAMIVSGFGYGSSPKIVIGGWAFVMPCVHRVIRVELNTMTIVIKSERVYTSQGVPISVTGVAQVVEKNGL